MAQMQNFWIYTIAIIVLISAINYICHNCINPAYAKILSIIGYLIIGFIIVSSLRWNNSWNEKENESKSQNLIKNMVDILLLIIILTILYNQFTK
jgi:hypothetical protein